MQGKIYFLDIIIICISCTVFAMELPVSEQEKRVTVNENSYNIVHLLQNNATYLKKLLDVEKKGLFCSELWIAENVLKKVINFPFDVNSPQHYLPKLPLQCCTESNMNVIDMSTMTQLFGDEAISLAKGIVAQGKVRDKMVRCISYADRGKAKRKFKKYITRLSSSLDAHSPAMDGGTIIHLAAKNCSDLLTIALENNGNVNALDSYGRTPLFYAVNPVVCVNQVQQLLRKEADVTIQACSGNTVLHEAVCINDPRLVHIFCLHLKKIHSTIQITQNNWGNTPLHIALLNNVDQSIVELLLDLGSIDFSLTNKLGEKPLDIARCWSHDNYNETLICRALKIKHLNEKLCGDKQRCGKVRKLLKHGAYDIFVKGQNNTTPLYEAVIANCIKCVRALFNYKMESSIDVIDKTVEAYQRTSFSLALSLRHFEIAEFFVKKMDEADRKKMGEILTNILVYTIDNNRCDAARQIVTCAVSNRPSLIDRAGDINVLNIAATVDCAACMQVLLDHKADINVHDYEAPFFVNWSKGRNCISSLITSGALANINAPGEHLLLDIAVHNPDVMLMKVLIDCGLLINNATVQTNPLLFQAVSLRNERVVGLLLDRGALVDKKTVQAAQGWLDVSEMLTAIYKKQKRVAKSLKSNNTDKKNGHTSL